MYTDSSKRSPSIYRQAKTTTAILVRKRYRKGDKRKKAEVREISDNQEQ